MISLMIHEGHEGVIIAEKIHSSHTILGRLLYACILYYTINSDNDNNINSIVSVCVYTVSLGAKILCQFHCMWKIKNNSRIIHIISK